MPPSCPQRWYIPLLGCTTVGIYLSPRLYNGGYPSWLCLNGGYPSWLCLNGGYTSPAVLPMVGIPLLLCYPWWVFLTVVHLRVLFLTVVHLRVLSPGIRPMGGEKEESVHNGEKRRATTMLRD